MIVSINLLQNQKDYKKLEDGFRVFRVGVVLFGFIALVCLIVIFSMNFYAQSSLKVGIKQRDTLLDLVKKMENKEAQILLIQEKMNAMNKIIRDTPDFSQNFETLLTFMPVASDSGTLQKVQLDEDTAQATLSFPNINALTAFLQSADRPDFQSAFGDIELSSISYKDPQKELEVLLYVGFKKSEN